MLKRRTFMGYAGALAGASLAWPGGRILAQSNEQVLVIGVGREPPMLTSAFTTAGPTQLVSGKLFDGLLTYDEQLRPQAKLATRWQTSDDGLKLTLHLREGVRWHDGKPFTSRDVAFSLLEVWKKFNARGRATFEHVVDVDSRDPQVAVLQLSKPNAYILQALSSVESQVIPAHLYENTDLLANPLNNAPVGNGPYRFVSWQRGRQLVLERNPDYWDGSKPALQRIVFRQLPDPASNIAALETGSVHLSGEAPLSYLAALARNPRLALHRRASIANAGLVGFEFNLDRPVFQDRRVRQAFAHAIDRDFLVKNVWYGYATAEHSPIPSAFSEFHSADVPTYGFDLARAEALLEEAGLKRGGNGIRLRVTCDPNDGPGGTLSQTAQVLRSNLAKIGVELQVRTQDFGEFVNRVYTRRDFDTVIYQASAGPDPAIGTQRFYWSKNFQPGVAFSNAAHYANPQVDEYLEQAQSELDSARRRELYRAFQHQVQHDLPKIPLVSPDTNVIASQQLQGFLNDADGILGNFADASLHDAGRS